MTVLTWSEDRVEQLFHEKSQSAYAAWNRLFDQTISALRFKAGGKALPSLPYCAHHSRIAYQPAGDRRRQPPKTTR